MSSFKVVCAYKLGTVMAEVFAVVAEEQATVQSLQNEHRRGAVYLALARGTVFLEIVADDPGAAEMKVHELPMASWWNLDGSSPFRWYLGFPVIPRLIRR